MSAPDRDAALRALDAIVDPRTGRGLVQAGLVRALVLQPRRAGFMLEVATGDAALYAPVRDAAEAALGALDGVEQAQVVLTAQGGAPPTAPYRTEPRTRSGDPPVSTRPAPGPRPASRPAHVRRVLGVASGKGGVGKSTVAVNLACAFARSGWRAGLLDADVYGPSAPVMLGRSDRPAVGADKKLQPLESFGVRWVSVGLLVDPDAAVIWRGPMASSAVGQLLDDVAWGSASEPLDVLVVDMPPGTGDVQLTLAQRVTMDGAVIVSTPQPVALADVRRGAALFAKTATPILGVVENMAGFPDPATGLPLEIFGRGGARAVAAEIGVPFLAEIPIDIALRVGSDEGRPLAAAEPDGRVGRLFSDLVETLRAALEAGRRAPPRIVVVD